MGDGPQQPAQWVGSLGRGSARPQTPLKAVEAPPPRGRPSATPTASNAGPQGARCGTGAGSPRPHRPHPEHTGRSTPAARARGRAVGGGTASDTRRPSQQWQATPPPGTAPHQPRGTRLPQGVQAQPGRKKPGPDPQARQTDQGTQAGHAEGHGPRGMALPAPSAGTARGAHATPPRGGGADAVGARAHAHAKDTRGLPEGQPNRARGTNRPRWMAYQRARVGDIRTGRSSTRSAGHAGREGGNGRDTTPGTGPSPPNRPRAPRTHRRATAPDKAVVAHCATRQPLGKATSPPTQGGFTGDKPVARARRRRRPGRPRIRGAMRWVSACSHGCELMH